MGNGNEEEEETASKINARARRCLNPERASVDNEARGTSGRDFDSSRPSLGILSVELLVGLALGTFGDTIFGVCFAFVYFVVQWKSNQKCILFLHCVVLCVLL